MTIHCKNKPSNDSWTEYLAKLFYYDSLFMDIIYIYASMEMAWQVQRKLSYLLPSPLRHFLILHLSSAKLPANSLSAIRDWTNLKAGIFPRSIYCKISLQCYGWFQSLISFFWRWIQGPTKMQHQTCCYNATLDATHYVHQLSNI